MVILFIYIVMASIATFLHYLGIAKNEFKVIGKKPTRDYMLGILLGSILFGWFMVPTMAMKKALE